MRMTNLLCRVLGLALLMSTSSLAADAPDFDKETLPSPRESGKAINGKTIAEWKAEVKKVWPEIVFEKDGKKVEYVVEFKTDEGDLVMEFFPDKAPIHARSFIALSKVGFHKGLRFHRIIPDFVIQGGCPLGNGTGGPGYALKAEFNSVTHTRGVLSMARANDPNSAGSQFFVCHGNPSFLDAKYTVFGKVVKGLETVDKIVGGPTVNGDQAAKPVVVKEVKVTVKGEAEKK